jgi:hypothetical protein
MNDATAVADSRSPETPEDESPSKNILSISMCWRVRNATTA